MFVEKRKNRRILFGRPVRVTRPNGVKMSLKSLDFSMDGIALLSTEKPEIGDQLRVILNIAPSGKVKVLNVKCEVKHQQMKGSIYAIGLKFCEEL